MFTLTIDTGNDAFMDGNHETEIARILRELAERIETYGTSRGVLRDVNGNTIGKFINETA